MTVSLLLALVAGALSPLNPCGFPLLPAFLSFYVGTEEDGLPRAANRIAQALLVGVLVTAGFLGVFLIIGVPITYGAGLLAEALPWAGLVIGLTLLTVGLVALAGRKVAVPLTNPLGAVPGRHGRGMVLFGAGYGLAALGCTLPTFLALVGVSLGASNPAEAVAIFAAYGTGMALSFMTLSLIAALFQQGLARALRRLAPYMSRISGALLAIAGAYLTYYWARTLFGSSATLATDPVIGPVTLFSARLAATAADRGLPIVLGIGVVIALAMVLSTRHRLHRAPSR
ncbi:MAG: cytochrome c biogenesis protein CcdA [Chloroflexia bacterium]|nr:cytochrome c biogenesis protein CcdA [Chloroflexia bacterium]